MPDIFGPDAPDTRCLQQSKPENFSLSDDMLPVERGFLADLIDDRISENWISLKRISQQRIKNARFRRCGLDGSRRVCPKCGIGFYTRHFCKHKLCDTCARIYGLRVREKILKLVNPVFSKRKAGWTVAMLTLSESSQKYRGRYPNREEYRQFNRNVGAFCRLFYGRYRGVWTKTGKIREDRKHYKGAGWFAVNEFGQDNTNLHCHILLYGPWTIHSRLLTSWIRITGGDTGCYIKPLRSPRSAADYVAKYLTKPPRFTDPNTALDYVKASASQRRIRTGGVFYNSLKKIRGFEPDVCPFCDVRLKFDGICDLTQAGDGLNLSHVRKHRELYDKDEIRSILRELPRGVLPAGLPQWRSLLPT